VSEAPNGQGRVVAIFTASQPGTATRELDAAQLETGRGIVGDRYHAGNGTFSPDAPEPDGDHELTLVEAEQIDRFNAETGHRLGYGDVRRNIVTRGIPLNDLVGAEFQVGEATVRGVRLCEPCKHLAGITTAEILPGLVHRAGLRAAILAGGTVRPGDAVQVKRTAG
jgi:MOSC domain-containing protein YiiM